MNIMKKDLKESISHLSDLARENGLCELEVEEGGRRIRVVVGGGGSVAPTPQVTQPSPAPEAVEEEAGSWEVSPMVGTVYLSPSPGSDHFISVGKQVKKGDTLLIVEAMKIMNPVVASQDGVVKKILVQNEQAVEFGQKMVLIDA